MGRSRPKIGSGSVNTGIRGVGGIMICGGAGGCKGGTTRFTDGVCTDTLAEASLPWRLCTLRVRASTFVDNFLFAFKALSSN